MYEDYLEDYVYKLMAKIASRMCKIFTKNKPAEEAATSLIKRDFTEKSSQINEDNKCNNSDKENIKAIEEPNRDTLAEPATDENTNDIQDLENKDNTISCNSENTDNENKPSQSTKRKESNKSENLDMNEGLNNLNFHVMLFFMWLTVTLVNMPALLTWARNFR